MPRAQVEVRNTVRIRDDSGRFVNAVTSGVRAALDEMAADGVALAESLAPKGGKPDHRTPPLSAAFYVRKPSPNKVAWGNSARHALVQEFGGSPHLITGHVKFWWEKELRWWNPGSNYINHPGNPAANAGRGYLRPSYEHVVGNYMDYLRRHVHQGMRY